MSGEETIDELKSFDLRVIQPHRGYRFSLDPLLLCDFAAMKDGEQAIDLGTGCGVIPLVLSRSAPAGRLVGLEFQESMARLAERNVALNGLAERIAVRHGDVLDVRKILPVSSFDLVLANPPYRPRGTGRISSRPGRDLARHESTAGLADFLAAAKYLVRPAGRICFIYHTSRLPDLFAEAAGLKLATLRLRLVHGFLAAEARMVLVELSKGRKGELVVEPPLIVYGEDGRYREEVRRILGCQEP